VWDARALVGQAREQARAFAALLGERPAERWDAFGAPPDLVSPQRVLATALAHAVLGGALTFVPLPSQSLPELRARLGAPGAPTPEALVQDLDVDVAARPMLARALRELAADLAKPEAADPRRVDALVFADG
jgi:hypothetical protein